MIVLKYLFPNSHGNPMRAIYSPQDIKSELDKVDILLNKIHITKDIPNLSDLEL